MSLYLNLALSRTVVDFHGKFSNLKINYFEMQEMLAVEVSLSSDLMAEAIRIGLELYI